jgi:thiamine transport system ATP-binding protein
MPLLEVDRVRAGYGAASTDVLQDVSLEVAAGEIVVLLGPSGSGKSTLLRTIAGLHPVRSGRVLLDGVDATRTPVEQRRVGLVFQDHALFPHRDVAGNVAFGPRMQGLTDAEVSGRVAEALAQVGLADLQHRAVDELSGGEQQRVALARALAAGPRLLLLDEPYGSLDRPLRERLLAGLPDIVAASGAGALLVTHDQQEALAVADRIAVIVAGRLRACAPPEQVWSDPGDAEVAAFLGVGPLLAVTVRDGRSDGPLGTLPARGVPDGPHLLLLPRVALDVMPAGTAPPGVLQLPARLTGVRFAGDHHVLDVTLPGGATVRLRRPGAPPVDRSALEVGGTLTLGVPSDALRHLPVPTTDQ